MTLTEILPLLITVLWPVFGILNVLFVQIENGKKFDGTTAAILFILGPIVLLIVGLIAAMFYIEQGLFRVNKRIFHWLRKP